MNDLFKVFDITDYKIIELLRKDARMPINKIAKIVNMDVRNTKKRIDKLTQSGALRFTVIADPKKFGYGSVIDINLSVDLDKYQAVVEILSAINNISYLAKGWGNENLTLQARFKNNEKMLDFIETELPGIDGVKVTSYILVPQIMRDIDHWLPQESDFSN
jgi:Lrp/AsnC family transcriptional regulator, regulator for asnA, asnC and gidA